MQSNLVFNISTYSDDNSTFPKPEAGNYDYWVPLLEYFLAKTDIIEIHCWNEEIETIEEITSLCIENIEIIKEDNLTIFKGIKTSRLSEYILHSKLNKNSELKWFTVNLEVNQMSVFHSGHWGTEFYVPNVSNNDIAFIKSVTPPETDYHQFLYISS